VVCEKEVLNGISADTRRSKKLRGFWSRLFYIKGMEYVKTCEVLETSQVCKAKWRESPGSPVTTSRIARATDSLASPFQVDMKKRLFTPYGGPQIAIR
jgi:hypothetical protein